VSNRRVDPRHEHVNSLESASNVTLKFSRQVLSGDRMMSETRKRLGAVKIIAIVIVLLVALAIAVPFVFDINQFRPEIESQLAGGLLGS
jgi:hypothetical protein